MEPFIIQQNKVKSELDAILQIELLIQNVAVLDAGVTNMSEYTFICIFPTNLSICIHTWNGRGLNQRWVVLKPGRD